jgi:hypothetical protein
VQVLRREDHEPRDRIIAHVTAGPHAVGLAEHAAAAAHLGTLISQGPAPNQLHQWDIRFKMDRSGAVTMDELRQEILCRG